jgi:Type II secretion system (T2SS), protein M subtype b
MSGPALLLKKAFVLLLPFLAAALIWAVLIAPVQSYNADLEAQLEAGRNLLSRYRRLSAQRQALQADLSRESRPKGMEELFYSAADTNAAAALLQQKLSALVTASGGQIRLARVDAKPKAGALDRFGVTLTFAVSSVGLSKVLFAVEGIRPAVLVDSLVIRGGPALARLQEPGQPSAQGAIAAEEPVLEVSIAVSGFLLPKG